MVSIRTTEIGEMGGEIKKSKRGGFRPGAGRPKGARAKATELAVKRAGTEGILPLEFMLAIMRDEEADVALRVDMAKAAAPYVHARLSQVDSTVKHVQATDELTEAELVALLSGRRGSRTAGEKEIAPRPH
jgi:hypothetical protein